MFDINAYANGYTVTKLGPKNVIKEEIAPVGNEGTGGPRGDGMWTEPEAKAMADALNLAHYLAERLTWVVTVTTEGRAGSNVKLPHTASNTTQTMEYKFTGPDAQARAEATYSELQKDLECSHKSAWRGYVVSVQLDCHAWALRTFEK